MDRRTRSMAIHSTIDFALISLSCSRGTSFSKYKQKRAADQDKRKENTHLRYLPCRRYPSVHRTADARGCVFRRAVPIRRRHPCLGRRCQKRRAHGSGWQHACRAGFHAPSDRAVASWLLLRVAPPRTRAQRLPHRSDQSLSTCQASHFPHSRCDKCRERARLPKGKPKKNVLHYAGSEKVLAFFVLIVRFNYISHCVAFVRAFAICVREGWGW